MKQLFALLILLLIVGCGTTGTVVVKDDVVEKDVVNVGMLKILPLLRYRIAVEKGFFEDENIVVKEHLLQSSNLAAEALVQGDVDVVPVFSLVPVLGIEAQQPGQIKVFATQPHEIGIDNFSAVITLDDSGIESLSDLEGKKVGVFPGSTASAFFSELLRRKEVDVDKVELIKIGPPQQLNALNSGSIDALFAYQPLVTIAKEQGNVKVIHNQVYASIINPAYTGNAAFSAKFAKENPDVAERFKRALLRATPYIRDHPDEARQVAVDYFGLTEEVAWQLPMPREFAAEDADMEKYKEFSDFLYEQGIIARNVDVKDVIWGQTKENDESVKIAFVAPLTGPAAKYGEWALDGVELALSELPLDERNRIELVVEDGQCSATAATKSVNKIIQMDKIPFLIGPLCQASLSATANLVDDNDVVILTLGVTSEKIAEMGENHFSFLPKVENLMDSLVDYIFEHDKARSFSVLYLNDDFGFENKDFFVKMVKKKGGSVLSQESFVRADSDFRTQLTKISNDESDAVFIAAYGPHLLNIVRQMRELGIEKKIYGINTAEDPDVFKELGPLADELTYPYPLDPGYWDTQKEFAESYGQKHGRSPEPYAANGYDSFNVLWKAMKSCSSDVACVRDSLYDTKDYHGAGGKITLDERGVGSRPISIRQWKDGEVIILND